MHPPTHPDPTESADQAVVRHALQRGLVAPPMVREALLMREELRRRGESASLLGLLRTRGLDPRHLPELEQVWRDSLTATRAGTRPGSERMPAGQRSGTRSLPAPERIPAEVLRRSGEQLARPEAEDPAPVRSFFQDGGHAGPPTMDAPRPGMSVGPFQVERELARGGMGIVYAARDSRLGRHVALKLLRPELLGSPKDVERHRLEAEAAARLRHANIVGIHEVGHSPYGVYLALDLIDGPSLRALLEEKGPFEPTVAARIAERVGRALHYAHSRAILHRDVKPHNILLDAAGEPHLTDFGLAKDVDQSGRDVTKTGQALGTPAYMAPEQAQGDLARVDRRADVWGLGATLYALLVGEAPFQGPTAIAIMHRLLKDDPTPPSKRRAGIDRDLETIVLKCLEKEPERRYPTCELLADDLLRWLRHEPIQARPLKVRERWSRWVRRNRALAAASFTAAALLLLSPSLLALGLVWQRDRTRAELAGQASREAGEAWSRFEAVPPDDVGQRTGQALAALQAAERWRALDDSQAAREAHRRAALALGEVALKSEQWHLAEQAFQQARAPGGDPEADARLQATLQERTNQRTLLGSSVRNVLEKAERQELGQPGQLTALDALFELVRWRDPATVRILAAALDEVTAELRRSYEELLVGTTPADGPERQELREALAQRWSLQPGQELATRARSLIAAGEERVRWKAVEGRRGVQPPPFPDLVAEAQRAQLRPGRREVARLAAEALGRIGIAEGAVPALCRYLEVESDQVAASVAAEALGRLGGDAAEKALAAARERFGPDGPFARRAMASLAASTEKAAVLDLQGLLQRAEARLQRDDVRGAAEDAGRVVEQRPDICRGWELRGLCRSALGDAHGAVSDFTRALEIDATGFETWLNRGAARLRLMDLEGAFGDFTQALKLHPDQPATLNNRGIVRKMMNDLQGALRDFTQAIELDPSLAQAWANRAEVRLLTGDLAGAGRELERALELDPRLALAWALRGRVRLEQGQEAPALQDLDRAIDLDPREPEHWNTRAVARTRMQDMSGALQDLDKAIELAPERYLFHFNRATVLEAMNRIGLAIQEMDLALRLDARQVNGWFTRGNLRYKRGDWQGALQDWAKVLELDPKNADAYVNRANVLRLEEKDYAGAIDEAGKALALDAKNASAHLVRALARSQLPAPDRAGAIYDLETYLQLAPPQDANLEQARRILQELKAAAPR